MPKNLCGQWFTRANAENVHGKGKVEEHITDDLSTKIPYVQG